LTGSRYDVADDLTPMSELCRRAQGDEGPRDALSAIGALRSRLDELERGHVGGMLEDGATWTEVAGALGISRQAAHSRFRDMRRAPRTQRPSTKVERVLVTGAARGTVRLARREAERLGAPAVGTEHLLLALTHDPPEPIARALRGAGVDVDGLRAMIQPTIVDDGEPAAAKGGFTRYAREVLEGSLREAVERGDGFISADHLLLSLLRNPEGGATRTLDALGVDPNAIRSALAAQH
jgi:hypothetical protein